MRALLFAAICLLGFGSLASAAPKAELWPFWQASNEASTATVDHAAWQQILDRYLLVNHPSGISRFDYEAVSKSDVELLDSYLLQLQALDPRNHSKAEQYAYWVNLYNALTVQRVLLAYPVDSILKVDGGIFRRGPWNKKYLTIADQRLSLNDIEHRILRPIWQDPRIHFAVNCASLGCPNLLARAYSAKHMEMQLDEAAREYLGHKRGLSLSSGGVLKLSKIFSWYQSDFGTSEAGVLKTLSAYLPRPLQQKLEGFAGPIEYHYDWALNQP